MPADTPRRGLFVTGTDTGVGKTLVTAALSRILSQRGIKVGVMKPVETGVDDPNTPGNDAQLLVRHACCSAAPERVSPYRYSLPAAPDVAAKAAGESIHPAHILAAEESLSQEHDFMFVEGAGGLMVPLRGGYLIADLAREMGYPLLIVTRPDLGTINHTLLTVHAARTMDLPVAGLIMNRMPAQPGEVEKSAPHTIASTSSADLLAVTSEASGTEDEIVASLAAEIESSATFSWVLTALGVDVISGELA